MPLITCPDCGRRISDAANSCPNCGRPSRLQAHAGPSYAGAGPQVVVVQNRPSNGIAALLSLLIPGAGQMYKGHVGTGIVWMIAVFMGYIAFVIPGLILHLVCIAMAASD
jgi:hypothetical protein